jgi:hypothetical protein
VTWTCQGDLNKNAKVLISETHMTGGPKMCTFHDFLTAQVAHIGLVHKQSSNISVLVLQYTQLSYVKWTCQCNTIWQLLK